MSEGDFEIDSLAKYLHLMPQQVQRMADRGKLPGRKVGGKWRFARAEIHHWLEARIGALEDDGALADMEGVLRRHAEVDAAECSIAELLPLEAIAAPLAAKTRGSVIDSMVQLAASTGLLWDPEKMADAVREREDMHSTALPVGVALMHPRRPMPSILSQPMLALGRTVQGIPFGGDRGQLTDLFFLICSVSDQEHLRTLARLSRLIKDQPLLDAIRAADDASATLQILLDAEANLDL